MIQDIFFDANTRETVLSGGDFQLTQNPSTQNGGIIQSSRAAFCLNPVLGVGVGFSNIGSPVSEVVYEMNRWKQQVIADGASSASFTINSDNEDYADVDIETSISYI